MVIPYRRFFLYTVMRFLLRSGTENDVFLIVDMWVVTAIEFEGVEPSK